MNLLTLPDEMLASVFRYADFPRMIGIRKLSCKVDSVVRRFHLNKCEIDSISLHLNSTNISTVLLDRKKPRIKCRKGHNNVTPSQVLKYYFSKIRDMKELKIYNSDYQTEEILVSSEIGELVLENSRKMSRFEINKCILSFDISLMKSILTNSKITNLRITPDFPNLETSDELIEGLEFDCLELNGTRNGSKLSLVCMARMCSRKLPSRLTCRIHNSTLLELGRFFETQLDSRMDTVIEWDLEVNHGTMSEDECVPFIRNLNCFTACTVEAYASVDDSSLFTFHINWYKNHVIYVTVT